MDDHEVKILNKLAIESYYSAAEEDVQTETIVEQSYVIVFKEEEEVQGLMEDKIQSISDSLKISKDEAIVLILYYGWDVSEIENKWFEDEKVREIVGLLERSSPDLSSDDKEFFCGSCFESHPLDKSASVSCNHRVCTYCWTSHIDKIIYESPTSEWYWRLKCPYNSCPAAISRDMIERFASKKEKSKYNQYLLNSYIDNIKTMKWCPASRCICQIYVSPGSRNPDVSCLCFQKFCWNCREYAHSPVDCNTAAKWLLENTLACPKCNRSIKKNQDNSLKLTCSPPCKYVFCWVCLNNWKKHKGQLECYSYIKYGLNSVSNEETDNQEQQIAESSVDRYKDCYENWEINDKLMQEAKQNLENLDSVIEDISNTQLPTPNQLNFIQEAWFQIMEFRRFLKWTNVYGYYLKDDDKEKQDFLKHMQDDAEIPLKELYNCVETELPLFLHAEGPLDAFNDFRIKLTERTSITRKHFERLVRDVENGLANVVSAPT